MFPFEEEALRLKNEGYYQISRKYCRLARLPENTSPRDALFDAAMKEYSHRRDRKEWEIIIDSWTMSLGVDACRSQYLRVYSPYIVNTTKEVIDEFRRIGGEAA